jgi:hypothetical protein
MGSQALADKDHRCLVIPIAKLPCGIHKEGIRVLRDALFAIAERHPEPEPIQLFAHFPPPFGVPWDHYVKNVWEILFLADYDLADQTFLARMGASRQNDRRGFSDAQFRKGLAKIPASAPVFAIVVEFYAARAEDSPRIDAQGLPAPCIGGFLNAKEVELIKYR